MEYDKVFPDTNILLNPNFDLSKYKEVYISIISIEELDGLKKSDEIGWKARQAIRKIKEANNIKIKLYGANSHSIKFLDHKNDNEILSMTYDTYVCDNEVVFLTDDYNLYLKAEALKLPCDLFEYKADANEIYTGIREAWITEQEYVDLMEGLDKNPYILYPNEYLIINNTTNQDQYLLMWNGQYFEEVKVRPISNKYINKINPLDVYQKAFIHMLQNDVAKVKITDSLYGAGKTFLMLHWALQMIDKGKFNKLYFVKSDSPPKGRKEYPALPGDINEKSTGLLGVLRDITSEDNLTDILVRNEKLEILPIQFAKGRSLSNSILFINEAQDFTPSEIERLLSRIGEGSVALLDGSTQQIDNKYCFHRNGLTVASNNFKDKEISAQVNMITDFRSDISKMVGEMDWKD